MLVLPESKPKVIFVLSVDTEEEFDWAGDFPQSNCSTENIKQLPEFQKFCDSLGVRPTYLVDYPVATNEDSIKIMRQLNETGRSEIGAHLHPWCSPPISGKNDESTSHVVNLSEDEIIDKMRVLTDVIEKNLNVKPLSFRTGRWGINAKVMNVLRSLGYKVDTSVFPYYKNKYFSCLNCPTKPYWPDASNSDIAGEQKDIFELPVTAGFNRKNYIFWGRLHRLLESGIFKYLKIIGFLWKVNVLRKIYLSPELSTASDMIQLVDRELDNNANVFHMFMHSSSLLSGMNSYARTSTDVASIYSSINMLIEHLREKADVEFCTILECSERIKHQC